MLAEIIKIEEGKPSKKSEKFIQVNFKFEDKSFGMTFLVENYRNFKRWKRFLKVGNILANLKILKEKDGVKIVDADSFPFLFSGEKVKKVKLSPENLSKMGVFG
jgi:hypothetical protein